MTDENEKRLKKWNQLDPSLATRIKNLVAEFHTTYPRGDKANGLILIAAPGRAEIIGSHTDYNQGLTISTNICHNLLLLARVRNDKKGRIRSLSQSNVVHKFSFNSIKDIERKKSFHDFEVWTNYIKGVLWSLMQRGYEFNGFDALIESSIPVGAGVSSSAAISLSVAHYIKEAYKLRIDETGLIDVCKTAENNYVGAPCGYLDQGTIELADSSWLVIDYKQKEKVPFSWKLVTMDLGKAGYKLIIGYDPNSKHSLVEGKYALRKQACELTLGPLSKILARPIAALGELKSPEFEKVKTKLINQITQLFEDSRDDKILRFRLNKHWKNKSFKEIAKNVVAWAAHIVFENERVSQAITALKNRDITSFGKLLSESGKSATFEYALNEDSPELSWVYTTVFEHKKKWGVLGIRNMGGGFNATTLALVDSKMADTYKSELNGLYMTEFNSQYNFLEFTPTPAVGRLPLAHLSSH